MRVYPKTIYTDIVGMPDPILLGITVHYYNHSDVNLYMKMFIDGPSPWSSNAVELGLLNSGSNTYINLDNFTSRTKPASATTEALTLTLRGYSDAGYSILLYEFTRSLTVVFIKSDDGSWTTDFLNNFDGGTVEGWDIQTVLDGGLSPTRAIATDYLLSTPYSLKGDGYSNWNGNPQTTWGQQLKILNDANELVHLGLGALIQGAATGIPRNKWMRIVVPLPVNTTFTLKIFVGGAWTNANYTKTMSFQLFKNFTTPNKTTVYAIINIRINYGGIHFTPPEAAQGSIYIWLDDFKIISK